MKLISRRVVVKIKTKVARDETNFPNIWKDAPTWGRPVRLRYVFGVIDNVILTLMLESLYFPVDA